MTQANATSDTELEALLEQFDALIDRQPVDALGLAQSALSLVKTELERGKVLVRLGWAQRVLSKLHDAELHNTEALAIFERLNDLEHHSLALILAGTIDVFTGHRERAYRHLILALEQSRAIGHRLYEARACNALGALFDWYSNPSVALEYLLEALRLMRELDEVMLENMTLSNIGAIYFRQGEYQKALECYHEALENLRDLNAGTLVGITQLNIAESLIKLDRAADAEALLHFALFDTRASKHVAAEVFALRTLGVAQLAQHKLEAAFEQFQAALTLANEHELFEEAGLANLGCGQVLLALGRDAQALIALTNASSSLQESSAENQLELYQALVKTYERLGDFKAALTVQRQFSALEGQYRETNSQRYVQSLMLRFELAQMKQQTAVTLERNRDLQVLVQEKERLSAELERLSLQDPLTGLFNRRYLDLHFPELLEVFGARQSQVAVAMIDIDFFKTVNDQFSHLIGDAVLRQIGALLQQNLRPSDIATRYGGEEFLIIFPGATLDVAHLRCEQLRAEIEQFDWQRIHAQLRVTISIGLVVSQPFESVLHVLSRADELLYAAKTAGRNRVISSTAALNAGRNLH